MTLDEIKAAVESGKKVYWSNEGYEVIKDSIGLSACSLGVGCEQGEGLSARTRRRNPDTNGQWLIRCVWNNSCISLTWRDGKTMNGTPEQFFIKE